jgi:hypothetical protein
VYFLLAATTGVFGFSPLFQRQAPEPNKPSALLYYLPCSLHTHVKKGCLLQESAVNVRSEKKEGSTGVASESLAGFLRNQMTSLMSCERCLTEIISLIRLSSRCGFFREQKFASIPDTEFHFFFASWLFPDSIDECAW